MRVTMTFHGPFRVSTGQGRPGIDATVDPENLLPASTLKGLMRRSAERLVPDLPDLVRTVFGSPRQPTAWSWKSAVFPEEPTIAVRARVRIDEKTGAATRAHLMYGEEVWARTAEFSVTRHGLLPESLGPEMSEDDHLTVLACAAAGMHSIGADRRRGLGWVQCATADPGLDEALVARFTALTEQWRKHRA
ncbi:RAMP superfamily CRISPR-associated protein [Streptomyces sp. NPDC047860]|uniref:RAMP superfamily CRISPR-associated protein n=1 Tax=Streptomyces sp. NPDC047860 TaxID=3155743 RepID=UPI0033DF0CE5